jgi:hypothetical protein
MDGNILVDEEACVCCQDVVSLTDMVHPKGTDWQGLLGVPPLSAHVCGKCARKLSAKRRTARRRNEQGSLGVSPEESAVPPSASRNQGWGTASSSRRCDAICDGCAHCDVNSRHTLAVLDLMENLASPVSLDSSVAVAKRPKMDMSLPLFDVLNNPRCRSFVLDHYASPSF